MFLVVQGLFGGRLLPRLRLVQCFITPFRLGLNWPCYLNVYYLPLPVRESLTGEILWLLLNSDVSAGWQGSMPNFGQMAQELSKDAKIPRS